MRLVTANPLGRDFLLLLTGSAASMLGDQFTLVALPLLVLTLSADPSALGVAFALMALPRAGLMLLGGAMADRYSPRKVLLSARGANALCLALLSALTLAGNVTLWQLYAIALGIGVSTAFAYPAGSAILPQVVKPEHLHKASGWAITARQLSFFVGPALAALVVAQPVMMDGHATEDESRGLGLAFAIDTVSFLLSLASLALIRIRSPLRSDTRPAPILASVRAGIHCLWRDVPLRTFTLYSTLVLLLISGPLQVGLPLLAATRMDLGGASLGVLMAANGLGMLAGGLSAATVLRHTQGRVGALMMSIDIVLGICMVLLANMHSTTQAAALLAVSGTLGGIGQIGVTAWMQQRVAMDMMGRVMSVTMVLAMGVAPLSTLVAGLLLGMLSLPVLFQCIGIALSLAGIGGLISPTLRSALNTAPRAPSQDISPALEEST